MSRDCATALSLGDRATLYLRKKKRKERGTERYRDSQGDRETQEREREKKGRKACRKGRGMLGAREAEVGGSRGQGFKTQPDQHGETLSLLKIQELAGHGGVYL